MIKIALIIFLMLVVMFMCYEIGYCAGWENCKRKDDKDETRD